MRRIQADIAIIGDSLGGTAAAISLAKQGFDVAWVTQYPWIGGQMTSQMVPPDEHPWIEEFGAPARYMEMRRRIRGKSGGVSNPGGGWVSHLCCEPGIAYQALQDMLAEAGPIQMVQGWPAECYGQIEAVRLYNGEEIRAKVFLDATETGMLLPLANIPYRLGAEAYDEFKEDHAPGQPQMEAMQPLTWCAALAHESGIDFRGPEPEGYTFWSEYEPPHWTGKLFNLTYPNVRTGEPARLPLFSDTRGSWFSYRQIRRGDTPATCMNWPQNDLFTVNPLRSIAGDMGKEISQCLLHWLRENHEPGLRFDPELAGTEDGLAQAPYIREGYRMIGREILTENDLSADVHEGDRMPPREDSVGIGAYRIDLHPRTNGLPTVDLSSLPFEIPMGCLIPRDGQNLIPACKNISVTHIANGATRLHPVEWTIGETAAVLAVHWLDHGQHPETIEPIASALDEQGVERHWPADAELRPL